jgi:hypothetical protein
VIGIARKDDKLGQRIIRCQAVVSSTLASPLPSVVMTRVGHAIFGTSARMSAHAIVCMKPS